MKNKVILPSQIRFYGDIKNIVNDEKIITTHVKNPQDYGWYNLNGVWFPHRKPTLKEIENDIFK